MDWQELKDETIEDLVSYIDSKGDPGYLELAEAAFCALTFRFRKDLIDKCVILCRKWKLTEDDAIELANRVFDKLWKYPRYKKEKCKHKDSSICFLRYLYKIANREIIGLANPEETIYDGTEKIVISLVDENKNYHPEQLKELQEYEKKLDAIFSKLTRKHKVIYLTYKLHSHDGHNLSGQLLKQLRDHLKISQSSIRVYKKQAYELVEKELGNV